ncbi:unnamed protein product [Vitrella brassicaformis CCMP3155]|uniref:Uncharacterized protein n=1 Tax=Vitrella brassicaformis (strain CCMP3155) TaxID=1169540 RepID=A0A0G4F0N6_VITBC|nr:unnamed protein product [Vitrella brassicaformis CCMP3155]|eukprot:CEM04620.1 unnamed protein product [Vitrella brassicaformis CCMP3155]
MSLLRTRSKTVARLPTRRTSNYDQRRLGRYPVPSEDVVWWENRFQVPGGQWEHVVSPFQLKLWFDWAQKFPVRWYSRLSVWFWQWTYPAIIFYGGYFKCCYEVDQSIKAKFWY